MSSAEQANPAEPWWLREALLPHLHLPQDLPAHFIGERAVTATDFDGRQNAFRLPGYGVLRNLRPILNPKQLEAANLLYEDDAVPAVEEEQGRKRKRMEGKPRAGRGLPVVVVDARAGIINLKMSRNGPGTSTTIKGKEYLAFVCECSFTVGDVVRIWAFKQNALYLVLAC